jgi:hypothetical protein
MRKISNKVCAFIDIKQYFLRSEKKKLIFKFR